MDSSLYQWNNLLDDKDIRDSSRVFFEKYLYRAEFKIPGGREIRHFRLANSFKETEDYLRLRLKEYTKRGYSSYFQSYSDQGVLRALQKLDAKTIFTFNTLMKTYAGQARFRSEHDSFAVYTMTEDLLWEIVNSSAIAVRFLEFITKPTAETLPLLQGGNTLLVNDDSYGYKIILREGTKNLHERTQLRNLIENSDDAIKPTQGVANRLKHSMWMTGYIYALDEQWVSMVQLVAPNLVRKIYKLVKAPTK